MQYILMRYQYNLLSNLGKVEVIKPIYVNPKIQFTEFFRMGNLLFCSFWISKQVLNGFEKLVELPDNIKFKYNFRRPCSVMIYLESNTNIIKYGSSSQVTANGAFSEVVIIR